MTHKNQFGRSMVEMLGVLAVMGVISIGGLYGYAAAIKKHRANELLNEASKRAVVVAMQLTAGKEAPEAESPDNSLISEFTDPDGYIFTVRKNPNNNQQFNMEILGVSREVCEQMKKMIGGVVRAISECPTEGEGTIDLSFNNDMSKTPQASDFNGDEEGCQAPFEWCDTLNKCQEAGKTCECPENSSTTEGNGTAITGTTCKCVSGYKLNQAGTGCEADGPYCATNTCTLYDDKGYTWKEAAQKCTGKTNPSFTEIKAHMVSLADVGCNYGSCPEMTSYADADYLFWTSDCPQSGNVSGYNGLNCSYSFNDIQDYDEENDTLSGNIHYMAIAGYSSGGDDWVVYSTNGLYALCK